MIRRSLACLLLLAACILLVSCGGSEHAVDYSSEQERLLLIEEVLPFLRRVEGFSFFGSLKAAESLSFGETEEGSSDSVELSGSGVVDGGSLSLTVLCSGVRELDGESQGYSEEYSLSGSSLSYVLRDGNGMLLDAESTELTEFFDFASLTETAEAVVTLLPYLSDRSPAWDDQYALLLELLSHYRLLLLRTGQGQTLLLPASHGSAARALASLSSVSRTEGGDASLDISIPLSSLGVAAAERLSLLLGSSIEDILDSLFGVGSGERILTAVSESPQGETVQELLARLDLLPGVGAEGGAGLYALLSASLSLLGASDLSEALSSVQSLSVADALGVLSGDTALTLSDAVSLLARLFSMTPDELLADVGTPIGLRDRAERLAETLRASTLSLSLVLDEDHRPTSLSITLRTVAELGDGARSVELTLAVSFEEYSLS